MYSIFWLNCRNRRVNVGVVCDEQFVATSIYTTQIDFSLTFYIVCLLVFTLFWFSINYMVSEIPRLALV